MGTTNILDLNNRLEKVEKENVVQNSYTSLKNKPKINNVTLTGNKSLADIGAAAAADLTTLAADLGELTDLTTTDKSSCVGAINELKSGIAFGDLPSNGFDPLTQCSGFFCFSVYSDKRILQGIPTNYSEYGTVFGCSGTRYQLLGYIDVTGKLAFWTSGNVWVAYSAV